MANHRYMKTNNGKYLVEQRKALFGWRTIRYLDSELHMLEEGMNSDLKKFEDKARKHLEFNDKMMSIRAKIEGSETEVEGAGVPFAGPSGFVSWVKSFFTEGLYPAQKTSWIEFYKLMKGKGAFKSAVTKVVSSPTAVVVGETVHSLQPQNSNQQRNQRGQRGQQNQQNQS
jgi:hypothetical protein